MPSNCRRHSHPHARVDSFAWGDVCSGGPLDGFSGYVVYVTARLGTALLLYYTNMTHDTCWEGLRFCAPKTAKIK